MVRPAIMITKPEIMEVLKHYKFTTKEKETLYKKIKDEFPKELVEFVDDVAHGYIMETEYNQTTLEVQK